MNREEKNRQTRRRIMDGALAEFAQNGYAAGSLNSICAAQGISKGIIYHYFESKDDMYLACVEECFLELTEYLRGSLPHEGTVETQLEEYFSSRAEFFLSHPVYRSIFCEAVISPPAHLADGIRARKQAFDDLNVCILERLLRDLPLRSSITMADVIETFRQFQNYINATSSPQDYGLRDLRCKKSLDILLYGVIDREGQSCAR